MGATIPGAFALCDIDHFKAYNDHLGHLAGDQALRAIASTIRATLRADDIGYRFGGEELLLVLRETTAEEAIGAAERIRAAVADIALPHPAGTDGILTISIGVAPGPGEAGKLLADADAALYEAKRSGRNRVVVTSAELGAKTIARRPLDSIRRARTPAPAKHVADLPRRRVEPWPDPRAAGALAATIRSELSFTTVAVNLLDRQRRELRAVVVLGDKAAQQTLLGSVNSWEEWEPLMSSRARPLRHRLATRRLIRLARTRTDMDATDRGGAWPGQLAPGGHVAPPAAGGFTGEILGVVSVDEPLNGQRPHEAELTILMAVADHAGLALERALDEGAHKSRTGRETPAHEI